MATTHTMGAFERSLAALDVGFSRTDPDGFEAALSDAITEPAVGARLGFEGLALPESVTLDPSPRELDEAVTGVTAASFAVAEYGSLILPSTADGSEIVSVFCDHHVAVLAESDLVLDIPTAFARLSGEVGEARASAIVATGPSATADMGELVRGAHGPKTVDVLLVEGL
jgi:L-lactate dehydrogenase complex protein LldG